MKNGESVGGLKSRSPLPHPGIFTFQKLKVVFLETGIEKIRIDRGTARVIFREVGNAEIFEKCGAPGSPGTREGA